MPTAPEGAAPVRGERRPIAPGAVLRWIGGALGGVSLRTEAAVASVSVGLLTVASVIGLRWSLQNAEQRATWAAHAQDVVATAQAVARRAADAQSGARGYALTHDRFFLDQYLGADVEFGRAMSALTRLAAADEEQMRRVEEARTLYERWRQDVARALEPAQGVADPATRQRVVASGKTHLDPLGELLDGLIARETRVLQDRESASAASSRRVVRASILGTALVVLVGAAGAVLFANRVGKNLARLTESAQAIAQGDLQRRVAVLRNDEIGSLARSFNRMAEQLDQQRREAVALNRMREMLHAAQTMADAERVLATLAPQCLPSSSGRLFLLSESRTLLAHAAGWGAGLGDEPFEPDDCWSFRVGRAHEVSDPSVDVVCRHRLGVAGATLCLPLTAQGETVGLLHLSYNGTAAPSVAKELGEMLALTLANLRLREAMRDQAVRDPLTGLFNRRYLDETFAREMARAARTGSPVGVVVVDIDHFKRVNDTYGHGAGDVLLKRVAALLLGSFRANDVVCRYGGEEFVAVLPDCGLQDAVRRAEGVREAMHGLRAEHEGRSLGRVTVSAGVAASPEHGRDPEALVRAADRALYRSKSEGRDRVTSADAAPGSAEERALVAPA